MNLPPAHSEPCSSLFLLLINGRLIFLGLEAPSFFRFLHNTGGEGGGNGGSIHQPPRSHPPRKMFNSPGNTFGMSTAHVVLPGSTTEEVEIQAKPEKYKCQCLSLRPWEFDIADQALIWKTFGQKFLKNGNLF